MFRCPQRSGHADDTWRSCASPEMVGQKRTSEGSGMPKPTIVLVHGAWADGSSWNAVSTELQGRGFTVLTPPNLLHGVAGDAAYVASFLAQRTTGPVVLVGHSY